MYDKVASSSGAPVFKRRSSPRDSSAMSFVFLSDSQVAAPRFSPSGSSKGKAPLDKKSDHDSAADNGPPEPSDEMERIKKLWEIISSRSDVDHPLCVECTDVLLDGMNKKLEATTRDHDALTSALQDLQSSIPSSEELREAEVKLQKAREKEDAARKELIALEKEKAEVDAELSKLEREAREMDEKEREFWRARNAFDTRLSSFQGERDSVNAKFEHDSHLLEKLQRSNVYNDTFCISHDGTFATINGLRLGKSGGNKNIQVDWPEINAAWGHALLLLVTVAEKLNLRFDGLEPCPMGSTSRIIKLEQASPTSSRMAANRLESFLPPPPAAPKKTPLELFYSNENLSLGRMFSRGRFGDAMVAFLELVRQLGVYVEEQTARSATGSLCLPYPIKDDRIGDVSIRLGIGQDEAWTKACKLTLTCCKFLLAHASNVSSQSLMRGST